MKQDDDYKDLYPNAPPWIDKMCAESPLIRATREMEARERYLTHLNNCDYCRNPCAEGAILLLNYRHAHDPIIELSALKERVVEAAVRFKQAEKAAWAQSELGTEESAAQAKTERHNAYCALGDAVEALVFARPEKK